MFLSILELAHHKLHGLTLVTPRLCGWRRSQRTWPSPTLGSLGPSRHRRHKSRVSLWGPPCAHGVSGIPLERCATYQPRFKSRGPDRSHNSQCNFCNMDGHFERECDLKSAIDRIKDYEHRLLERRHRSPSGQIHNLEETAEDPKSNNEEFLANQVVDACLVELNMLETPQQTTSWYLDYGATHHVSGDSNFIFSPPN